MKELRSIQLLLLVGCDQTSLLSCNTTAPNDIDNLMTPYPIHWFTGWRIGM